MVVDKIQADVSEWLHRSVEEPPHNVDVDAILATERMRGGKIRSGKTVVTMLAASAAVAAVAVGISFSAGTHHHQSRTPLASMSSTPTAAPLIGTMWHLVSISGLNGTRATSPQHPAPLQFYRDGTVASGRCTASRYTRPAANQIKFVYPFTVLVNTTDDKSCNNLSIDQYNFVYGEVLSGTVVWKIASGTLTITHAGVGAVTYAT